MRIFGRVLQTGSAHPRGGAEDHLPPAGGRCPQRAQAGAGHHHQQPPVVLRSLLRPAPAAPAGDLPGQVRVLHRQGAEGLHQQGLLHRAGPGPDRPQRRRGQRAGHEDRPARPGRGQPAGYLPGGHPQPGRAAVQGQDRRGPAGPGGPGPGDPVRDDQHVRVHAVRSGVAQHPGPARGPLRRAARLLPLLRSGHRPPCAARGHRRDYAGHREAVRPAERGQVRPGGQGDAGPRPARRALGPHPGGAAARTVSPGHPVSTKVGAMRVGVLTGGGDCPGLNAVIRAVVRKGVQEYGYEFVGFRDGWRGPLEGDTVPLDVQAVRGILPRGGTILGTSRTNPFASSGSGPSGAERIKDNLAGLGGDALIAIGGEDTLGAATKLYAEGVNVVGVPKTIDNDLGATDYTFGFDTAVNIAMEAIDRLHTTAASHHRALIVEVMGRHAGWIALHAGLAGGANVILIPERPFDIDRVIAYVEHRFQTRYAPIVVVAEGAHPLHEELSLTSGQLDAFGHVRLGGVGQYLADEIEKRTGKEARCTVLGHIQRGGTPTAFDRVLATRFGLHAVAAVHDEAFGTMVALRGTEIVRVPLAEATRELKLVPPDRYAESEVFFG